VPGRPPRHVLEQRPGSRIRALESVTANPADVLSANDTIGSLKQLAAGAGQPITEQTPSSV